VYGITLEYFYKHFVRVMTSRRMRLAGRVVGDKKMHSKFRLENSRKRSLGRHMHRWDNTEIDLK
jgi:hypothetical protein